MMSVSLRAAHWLAALGVIILVGCAVDGGVRGPVPPRPADVRAQIAGLLPASMADRMGWAVDIHAAFTALGIPPSPSNICAVLAITEQESTFQADPPVPNLGRIAREEIDRRADRLGVPKMAVDVALGLSSPSGKTYGERIEAARTEKELSLIYEDFIGMVPMGKRLFSDYNPVRTGGPMQVSIAFAEQHARTRPYPYPVEGSIRHEVFTRRGGVYFGIAHLLDYSAPYDRPLYRFADFNAGRYASRNAAFQSAVSIASGIPLVLDGDLVRQGSDAGTKPGNTELAARSLNRHLDMSEAAIRRALEQGESAEFERSALYRRVFELAEKIEGRALPRAVVPTIELKSPKITRKLTTDWFANRVDGRHRRCLSRVAATAGADDMPPPALAVRR